jgi:hypothetical protein
MEKTNKVLMAILFIVLVVNLVFAIKINKQVNELPEQVETDLTAAQVAYYQELFYGEAELVLSCIE